MASIDLCCYDGRWMQIQYVPAGARFSQLLKIFASSSLVLLKFIVSSSQVQHLLIPKIFPRSRVQSMPRLKIESKISVNQSRVLWRTEDLALDSGDQETVSASYRDRGLASISSPVQFRSSSKKSELENDSPSAAPHSTKKPSRRPDRSLSTNADWSSTFTPV